MGMFDRIVSTGKPAAEMAADLEKAADDLTRHAAGNSNEAGRRWAREAEDCSRTARQFREDIAKGRR